jgi:hypothetical protein
VTMTYASVVFVGFMALAFVWYIVHARKGKSLTTMTNVVFKVNILTGAVYNGPPESDSLAFGH